MRHAYAWPVLHGFQWMRRTVPVFKDQCGHLEKGDVYVGSCCCYKYDPGEDYGIAVDENNNPVKITVDVYLYTEPVFGPNKVCIRYGDEAWEYMTGGTVIDVIRTDTRCDAPVQETAMAAHVLDMYCEFDVRLKFSMKKKKEG